MADKNIKVGLQADTSLIDKQIENLKKGVENRNVEMPITINTKEITDALNTIRGHIEVVKKAFDKDFKFSGLTKGLGELQKQIDKVMHVDKHGNSAITVNQLGMDEISKHITEVAEGMKVLNSTKIDVGHFDKLAEALKRIETLLDSIRKGMNFDTIRPSTEIQSDIEKKTAALEKQAKAVKKVNDLEKYLNGNAVKTAKKIISWGDSADVSGVQKLIDSMKEYIRLGGDLSKIKFKMNGMDTPYKSLLDAYKILQNEKKIDAVDTSQMKNDVNVVRELQKSLVDLNEELAKAKARESRDLTVGFNTESVEKFTAAITEAVRATGSLKMEIPKDISFDGLSTENLDKIIGKLDEMVGTIKNIGTLLSTGIDMSKFHMRDLDVKVNPKVDTSDFIDKIEKELRSAGQKVRVDLSLLGTNGSKNLELINSESITGLRPAFKEIANDFGLSLQSEVSGIKDNLTSVMGQIKYDSLFESLRASLLDIVRQFQNSLNNVTFSKDQFNSIKTLLNQWNDASNMLLKAGRADSERAALLSRSTGAVSNGYLYDKEGSFSGHILDELNRMSKGVGGQIGELYDTWVHSHPLRKSQLGLQALGSNIGFTVDDLEVYRKKYLKQGVANMMVANNGKYANINWSGISDDIMSQVIKSFKASPIFGSNGMVIANDFMDNKKGIYNLDLQSDALNGAIVKAMQAAGIKDAKSRLTTGNISDLKADLSTLHQQEQKAEQEAQELVAVFKKLSDILDSFNNQSITFGLSEQSLDKIIKKLNEVVEAIRQINAISQNSATNPLLGSGTQNSPIDSQIEAYNRLSQAIKEYADLQKTTKGAGTTATGGATGSIDNELNKVESLKSKINSVTEAVNEKTNAFRNEEQAVSGVVQSEISSLQKLESQLQNVVNALKIIKSNSGKADSLVSTTTSTSTSTSKFDNDIQRNLVYLENFKNTIREIDRLKLEPETDETIQKFKELNQLADYYASRISVIQSENGAYISAAGMKNAFGQFSEGLTSQYTKDQLNDFYKIGLSRQGIKWGQDLPDFKSIGDEIKLIESKSESFRASLASDLLDSKKYVENLRRSFVTLAATTDELKNTTSPKWIAAFNRDIDRILSKYPELAKFKDKFTEDSANAFVKSDDWTKFLSQLPKAQKYLDSIKKPTKSDTTTQNVSSELAQLDKLQQKTNEVKEAVDKKTSAFKEEEQSVSSVVQSEISSLQKLEGQLQEIIGKIKAVQDMPIVLDIKPIQSDAYDAKLTKFLSDLKEAVQSLDISSLEKVADTLNGLKVPDNASKNLSKVAKSLKEFRDSITNMSASESGFLSSISAIVSKSEELRNLCEILSNSAKSIEKAGKAAEKSTKGTQGTGSVSNIKQQIDRLNNALKSSFVSDIGIEKFNSTLQDVIASYNKLIALQKEGKISAKEFAEMSQYFDAFKSDIYKNSLGKFDIAGKTPEFVSKLKEAESQLLLVKAALDKVKTGEAFTIDDISNIEKYISQVRELSSITDKLADIGSVHNLLGKIGDTLSKNTAMPKKLKTEFQLLSSEIRNFGDAMPIDKLREFAARYKDLESQMKASGKTGDSFFTGVMKRTRYLSQHFIAMYLSLYDIIRYVRNGLRIIKEIDTAYTEMRKVSDENTASLKNFQVASFEIADGVGTTAKQIQQSTADWMRLGESLDEASKSAENSNILLNVSEFENIDAATESLVAMSAAYSELDKMSIIDKLNQVGNNFSISTDGLATALQRSASALKTAGNDMDEAVALVTAGNQIVQDPDSVGAGLRTIALRISGTEAAKQELEELGEDVDDFVVQTTAKSQQTIKDFTRVASNDFQGFDILDENGNFKSTYEILLGISEIYEEIVETDKEFGSNMANGLLEALAGILFCQKNMETYFYRTHLIARVA